MFGIEFANKLNDIWPKIKTFPFNSKEVRINVAKHKICSKNDEVYDFFTFIQLISTHRVTFDNAIKALIKYNDVGGTFATLKLAMFKIFQYLSQNPLEDPVELMDKSLTHPYIIAIASQIGSSFKFYIHVENRLFSVS